MTGRHYDIVTPLGQSILGGTDLGDEMRLISSQAVNVIAAALRDLSSQELVGRYDAAAMDAADVYPATWRQNGPIALHMLLNCFDRLRNFYSRASLNQQAVVAQIS